MGGWGSGAAGGLIINPTINPPCSAMTTSITSSVSLRAPGALPNVVGEQTAGATLRAAQARGSGNGAVSKRGNRRDMIRVDMGQLTIK
jgi:hypothetical protein